MGTSARETFLNSSVPVSYTHLFPCQMAAVAVALVVSVVPFLFGFQGVGGCQLHGAEHAAVDVALHFQYPLHKVGVACPVSYTHLDVYKRQVDIFSHRLQVQERMTLQIKECIQETLNPLGVMVVVEEMCIRDRPG